MKENLPGLSGRSHTVLLVDDEDNVLKSLGRVLRREPYRVITAPSGAQALEALRREPVELIVSDQRMPEMTGTELLARAREINPDAVRIILTGFSDLKTAEEAINKVEIYRFLFKPWNDEDLKATIRQGLARWDLEQDNRRLLRELEEKNRELREWNRKLEEKVEERTRALKEAEAQMVQAEKMASLGVLAGGVAHELNNPLGGIIGISQLLLQDLPETEQLAQDVRTINQAAVHCSQIVKNLLAFARKGTNELREPVDLSAIVNEVGLLIGHLFRNKGIELRLEFGQNFPRVLVSPPQFRQVLLNLLVNAQQALDRPGVITVRGGHGPDGDLVVEVEDQGPGIPPGIAAKIFDPFFTTKPEGEGTGLGLSVTYRIVADHGGRIEAVPDKTDGACIRMTFPRSLAVAAPPPGSVVRRRWPAPAQIQGG